MAGFTKKEDMIRYRHMFIFEFHKKFIQINLITVRTDFIKLIQYFFYNNRSFFDVCGLKDRSIPAVFTHSIMWFSFFFTKDIDFITTLRTNIFSAPFYLVTLNSSNLLKAALVFAQFRFSEAAAIFMLI